MILVTGAAGTVGSQVVKALSAAQARFRVAYHRRPVDVPGTEPVFLDLTQPETIPPALAGVHTVFLLSASIAPETHLVDAARAASVERIVKLSAWKAADESFTYGRWHREVERAIEASGLAWTFLRPNGFMQNAMTYTAAGIWTEDALYESAPDARIAHIDARDIGAAAARVLTEDGHAGKAYDLSGPRALDYREIAELLSAARGRRVRCVAVSDDAYRKAALSAGAPPEEADALVDLNRYYRTGAAATVTPNVRELTGREPIPFERFVHDYAPALRPAAAGSP